MLQGTGVAVVGAHPGAVYTKLRDGLGARWLKWLWFPMMKTPVQGAQTTLYCALEPSVANLSGHFFSYVFNTLFTVLTRSLQGP